MTRCLVPLFVLAACGTSAGTEDGDDQQPIPCDGPNPGCTFDDCNAGLCVDIPVFTCDETTGEWVEESVICEGILVSPVGELVLTQWVRAAADECPPLAPRNPLVLSVHDDGFITAAPPIVIIVAQSGGGWDEAHVAVLLRDEWGDLTPTLEYDITIFEDGDARGLGVLASPTCDAEVDVEGTRCPSGVEPCGVFDDGWNVLCWSGAVHSDDLTRYAYCGPGSTVPACEVGGEGGLTRVATCPGECADSDVHWFETFEEYAAFDPTTLCAP